ncbi:MAG: hypothetical protein ACFFG0_18160 [Candidatus Thorarchaeota archaeon]
MTSTNPTDIFNDFRSGKIDNLNTIKKLLSISRNSKDEELGMKISEILLEMYRSAETYEIEQSENLKTLMEQIVGEKFISKYKIIPREAMAIYYLIYQIKILFISTKTYLLTQDHYQEKIISYFMTIINRV